ncbi:MAG: hypothetical protein DHS20C13_30310 [Thermodesulfobacteriota bacterium]|nr:MAG: hypothetical protein DHS20C13_30310 [Thermodesulfobacteriota bacterium]
MKLKTVFFSEIEVFGFKHESSMVKMLIDKKGLETHDFSVDCLISILSLNFIT